MAAASATSAPSATTISEASIKLPERFEDGSDMMEYLRPISDDKLDLYIKELAGHAHNTCFYNTLWSEEDARLYKRMCRNELWMQAWVTVSDKTAEMIDIILSIPYIDSIRFMPKTESDMEKILACRARVLAICGDPTLTKAHVETLLKTNQVVRALDGPGSIDMAAFEMLMKQSRVQLFDPVFDSVEKLECLRGNRHQLLREGRHKELPPGVGYLVLGKIKDIPGKELVDLIEELIQGSCVSTLQLVDSFRYAWAGYCTSTLLGGKPRVIQVTNKTVKPVLMDA